MKKSQAELDLDFAVLHDFQKAQEFLEAGAKCFGKYG